MRIIKIAGIVFTAMIAALLAFAVIVCIIGRDFKFLLMYATLLIFECFVLIVIIFIGSD